MKDSDTLPQVCFHCGISTQRVVKFVATNPKDIGDPATDALAWFVGLGKFISLFRMVDQATAPRVSLNLPYCGQCDHVGFPKADYVDFGAHKVTFIVHRSFAEAVKAQQGLSGR
jgi:hypothetical protein